MSSNPSSKKNVLLVFGALAIVLVAVFVIWRPPALKNEDASGAIGAVEKHHETQITPQDVVLGDEATKQDQNVVFGDLFNDSAKLKSISDELGAMAAAKVDNAKVTAAANRLADSEAELQARYAQYAGRFVTAANRLASKAQDQKLAADLSDLGARVNAKMTYADMDQMNARLAAITASCSRAQARIDAASRAVEAANAMQARSPEAASRLNDVADALEARAADSRLSSISSSMAAITMEARSIQTAQSRLASMAQSKNFAAKELNDVSLELGRTTIDLQSRALANLAARLNDEAELGAKLASIDAQMNAKAQSITLASMMANRADNISAAAASRVDAALNAYRADYAARTASMITMASHTLDAQLNAQPMAAARADSRLAAREAANREAYAKSFAAMRQLGQRPEVAARVDSRILNNLDALQARAAARAQ